MSVGDEDKYTLDSHGFRFYRHTAKEKDFLDDEKITTEYYEEVDELLKAAYVENVSLHSPDFLLIDANQHGSNSHIHLRSHHSTRQWRSRCPPYQQSCNP